MLFFSSDSGAADGHRSTDDVVSCCFYLDLAGNEELVRFVLVRLVQVGSILFISVLGSVEMARAQDEEAGPFIYCVHTVATKGWCQQNSIGERR